MSVNGWNPSSIVLVVDLGEVIRQPESALEAFWVGASARWSSSIFALVRQDSHLSLRDRFAAASMSVPARLAYREDVLATVRDWRRQGGQAVLVSASESKALSAIADHLGIFDEVHTLPTAPDLREEKLTDLFGPGGYSTFQPSAASPVDLPLESLQPSLPSTDAKSGMPPALRLVRPHQWLKNLLIFVPVIAAHEITMARLWPTLLAFIAFSLIASSTYVLNDLLDLNADRAHPRKCRRPLASGAVSLAQGTLMVPALAMAGCLVAAMAGPKLLAMLALYFVLTTAYSLKLKRLVVIDICMLAVLYTMRILAGSVATGIPSSVWLLAFSIFFFFSLAGVKRQAELVDGIASGLVTAHGRGYHVNDLAIVSNIVVASGMVSVMVLALYSNSQPVMHLYSRPEMLWGVCLVLLFWNSRIAILTNRGEMHDDPLVFAARDRISQICGLAILALAIAGTML